MEQVEEQLSIEYVPLHEVRRWPRNPKLHDQDALGASIKRFGFVQPITPDARTGQLVAGHGRLEALEAMRAAGAAPPRRIRLGSAGEWLVPVVRGVSFETEAEAEAYLVADNRLVEIGGWDDRQLTDLLKEIHTNGAEEALRGTGFDGQQLAALVFNTRPAHEVGSVNEAAHWVGLPEFEDARTMNRVIVHFRSEEDRAAFMLLVGAKNQQQHESKKVASIWWPDKPREDPAALKFVDGSEGEPA